MWHAWGRREVFTVFWYEDLKARDHWEEDNIKMVLREIEIDWTNWIQVAQDKVQWRDCVNTVMNLRVP
jgi:hypothetical protein